MSNNNYDIEKENKNALIAIGVLLILALITDSAILLLIAIIIFISRVTGKNARKTSNPQNTKKNKTTNINPQWERVLREDGTEYFRLKRNNPGLAVAGGQTAVYRKYPYKKRDLLTQLERDFWKILKNVCDANNLLICPKVRMEDFIEVEEEQYASKQKFRGKIKSRHIDFMICDKNLNVLAGIELDDSTHNRKAAQETDAFKNQVFTDIQIPLYRIKVKSGTNIAYLGEVTQIIKEITEQNILPIK